MVASAPEHAENWDDDYDFDADDDGSGTKLATPFTPLTLTTTSSHARPSTNPSAHSDPFLSSNVRGSSSVPAFAARRKLSAHAEEEDWDAELKIVDSAISNESQLRPLTIQHDVDPRTEVTRESGGIENWDDDFEDASSPRKSTSSRPSPGDSLRMTGPAGHEEEDEVWDDEVQDLAAKFGASQIQSSISPAQPSQEHPVVSTRVSSLQPRHDLPKNEKDEFGLLAHDSSDDEDHTVTARQRRRYSSTTRSPPPPLPQLPHANQASLAFPQPNLYPPSPSGSQFPVFSPTGASGASPSVPSPKPSYARSPSAMSNSSAGSSSNIHGQSLYAPGSHMYHNTTRPSGFGYTSASVFSLPNTLHSHTSHGSTVPLTSTNKNRPSTSGMTPTTNRLRKQPGVSSSGFSQLPPSPLVHKERERRRLRKKSRPSVENKRDVFVVDEDVAGRESEFERDYEQHEQLQEADADPHDTAVYAADPPHPPSKHPYTEKGSTDQIHRSEELATQKQALPQTPRAPRAGRSVSAGPEHGTAGVSPGHGNGGLLQRIGSVKRWAKAKRRRGSTTPQEVEDRVADADVSASDFSERYPRQPPAPGPIQPSFSEQVQRTPRPRSSMSSFPNTSRGGSPSPSPGSPSRWPNFFRNNDMSSPSAQKSRRRMTMGPIGATPTPTRTRANTITKASVDKEHGHGKFVAPRRSNSQSRSRGAQVYGSALNAARASNGSLALNASKTSLSSVKEHDSPAPRTRRKSFGRLIMDRLPSTMKTPEKNKAGDTSDRQTDIDRPNGTVRRISLMSKRAKSPVVPSGSSGAANEDNNHAAPMQAPTPTRPRARSRSRKYDLEDAPPVPELSGPYYGILRNADSNISQQSLALQRQQSRASSSASHLPLAPPSDSRRSSKGILRVVSGQSDASMRQPLDPPGRPSLSSVMSPTDFSARLKQLGDTPESSAKSEIPQASPRRPSTSEAPRDMPPTTTSLSLLPPIELHPPSPPQTLGFSTSLLQPGVSGAPASGVFEAPQSSQGSDINSATTSTSSLFYTPTSSPSAKKRSTGKLGLSASPHSPGKASSLGRTTGPIVGSDSVGYSGSGTIGKSKAFRRNSLGDLKIPTRISQAQVSIRRDLGLVKEFAGRIEELKGMKTTYMGLLDLLQAKIGSSNGTQPATAASLMDLFNGTAESKPEPPPQSDRDLQNQVASVKMRYDISWECAELLIELGGGPVADTPEQGIPSASTVQSEGGFRSASDPAPRSPTASHPSYAQQLPSPATVATQTSIPSAIPGIAPKRSRERAITLASSRSTSGSTPGPPLASPVTPMFDQSQPFSGSIKAFSGSSNEISASAGRRDLSQRQLLLLREMLSTDASTSVRLPSEDVTSAQTAPRSAESGPNNAVTGVNFESPIPPVGDKETSTANTAWRWGASSTIELPTKEQERAAYVGQSRQASKVMGHRRQWSHVGLGKPSRGNPPQSAEALIDDEEQQKRWKGMRAIRDMLRAMKRVRTEVPEQAIPHHDEPPSATSPSQPVMATDVPSPLPSNRVGGSSSRFAALGVRMGMHSTSSLSSAVSMTSYGSKRHPSENNNQRTISTGASLKANPVEVNQPESSTLGRQSNQATAIPQQYQGKAPKSGPRRPSLASLFRLNKSEPSPANPKNTIDAKSGKPTALNSSLERQGQGEAGSSTGSKDEGQEVEDDWDRMDSASDIETRHNATVRAKPDQRRKLLKGNASRNPYHSQPSHAPQDFSGASTENVNKHQRQTPLSPANASQPVTAHETASQSSLSLSSSQHGHIYRRPSSQREQLVKEGVSTESQPPSQPTDLPSPQYSTYSSPSHLRSPLSPVSLAPPSDLRTSPSHAMSLDVAVDSRIALAMTPENIKPLLENAKEVQERLSDCLRELTELLHRL